MLTKQVTVEVPASLARELDSADQEFLVEVLESGLRSLRIERALKHYAAGGVSLGAAARQAGVSHSELARQAYARGMEPPFSEDTVREELA
mgnify:CR=1 FL=1